MTPEGTRPPECASHEPAVPLALAYRPRLLPNAVDVTGLVPEDVRIDPYITAGHPGYEESGESQIIPLERLAGRQQEHVEPSPASSS